VYSNEHNNNGDKHRRIAMKRILLVNKYYYPDTGGVETVVKQYAEHLSLKNRVIVLSAKKAFNLRTEMQMINNVKVIRCSSLGTYFSMPLSFSLLFWFIVLRTYVDIIHFHEPFPLGSILSVFRKGKRKYILTWQSDIIRQKAFIRIVEIFQKILCRKANIITTSSPALRANSRVLRLYKRKVIVIPPSIDSRKYIRNEKHSSLVSLPKIKPGYILSLGRLSYYKGILVLLGAFKRLSQEITLVIAGDGELKRQIRQIINREKLRIVLIDRVVNEEEKLQLISNASIFLFPSILSSEAFGILQLEAMAMGKPIINTWLPTGVPWVSLNEVTGLTVEPNNEIELAEAIDILLKDHESRAEYGSRARKRVIDLFDDQVIFNKLDQVYKALS
jgi:glycosyltransferase involved in cell wall biosynthesis